MKRALPIAAAMLLSACIGGRSPDPVRYFTLDPGKPATPSAGPAVTVAPTTAAGFYGTAQIVYSDMPGVRARYRYSFWTERPQELIYTQLQARLAGSSGENDLVLETRLNEIYHDASSTPGVVRVTVTAALYDAARHELVARRRFTRAAPATAFDARGAVAGMRVAIGEVLDDIVGWVRATAVEPKSSS